jgi:hypothetical protein
MGVIQRWHGFSLQAEFAAKPGEWATADPEWGRRNEPLPRCDFGRVAECGFDSLFAPDRCLERQQRAREGKPSLVRLL